MLCYDNSRTIGYHSYPFIQAMLTKEKPVKIREAKPRDMKRVVEIVKSSADWYEDFVDDEDMSEHDPDLEWAKENFRKRDFYVGEIEDDVFGTVSMQNLGGWCYLGYVYLHTDYVGRGLGKKLLTFAEREARNKNMKGLALIAHPKAKWAVRAYEKFGFRVTRKAKEQILRWQNGALKPYHEEGFHLFQYPFD